MTEPTPIRPYDEARCKARIPAGYIPAGSTIVDRRCAMQQSHNHDATDPFPHIVGAYLRTGESASLRWPVNPETPS